MSCNIRSRTINTVYESACVKLKIKTNIIYELGFVLLGQWSTNFSKIFNFHDENLHWFLQRITLLKILKRNIIMSTIILVYCLKWTKANKFRWLSRIQCIKERNHGRSITGTTPHTIVPYIRPINFSFSCIMPKRNRFFYMYFCV